MIKIAFCDDEVSILNKLSIYLDKYRVERNCEIEYITFNSPFDLLFEIENGTRFDIVFLDIIMPIDNGIDVAMEIRKFDREVKIIFLTSTSEFAVESYLVGAYFYQLKPIREESFFSLMDSAVSSCEKEQADSLILRCKSGITRIRLQHLEYCEVIHRTLLIHLTNGEVLECSGSLDELSKQLESHGGFLRFHRSYLVNLEHVKHLSYKSVTTSSLLQLPIPRGKYSEVKDTYLEYMFKNNQVMI
ncbi:MAG: response regulator transcription factor [Ruminococcus sp.]|nr:response regulator transcription factor [Ruminococcus sp.]